MSDLFFLGVGVTLSSMFTDSERAHWTLWTLGIVLMAAGLVL